MSELKDWYWLSSWLYLSRYLNFVMRGKNLTKPPSLKSVTHPPMMKLGSYTLPKKIQKLYESRGTTLEFCWHQDFVTGNQQILPYQEIQILIPFRSTISNSTNFSRVFKHCFNKHGHNFNDVNKNGYPRPS